MANETTIASMMVTKTKDSLVLTHRSAWERTLIEGHRGRSFNAASVSTASARDKSMNENPKRTLNQDSLIAVERITSVPEKTLDRNSLIVIEGITSEPEKYLNQDSFITSDKVMGDPERCKDAQKQFMRTL